MTILEIYKVGIVFFIAAFSLMWLVLTIRRTWFAYWRFVNSKSLHRIVDNPGDWFFGWDNIVNNNSPWAFIHLFTVFILYSILALIWPITFPVAVVVVFSFAHRKSISRKTEFEKKLKGAKTQT